jgi:GNAT superfamily N-acetyltransferase
MSSNLNPLLEPKQRTERRLGSLHVEINWPDREQEQFVFLLGLVLVNDSEIGEWCEQWGIPGNVRKMLTGKRLAVIDQMNVDYPMQGEGWGKRLLGEFERRARHMRASAVALLADTDVEQREGFDLTKFYKLQGYRQIGAVEGDAVHYPIMLKELPAGKQAGAGGPDLPVQCRIDIMDARRGELFGKATAWLEGGGPPVGYIDFSEYEDEVWIKYIYVSPGYRRRGVGEALVEALKEYFPGERIAHSGLTDKGGPFWGSLKGRGVVAKAMDYGQLRNILSEMMGDVEGGLPTPELKVVNHTRPRWGGLCRWELGQPNTTIEIQKAVTADERSFRRILAHELCHHEQYLVHWSRFTPQNFKFMTRLEGGHGRVFRQIMDRWNAKHGKDFVTVTSDKDILQEYEDRPFFVFMQRYFGGRPMWQASLRLTDRQLRYMSGKRQGDYRLVQTGDRRFIHAPVIGSGKGWQYVPTERHEWEEAAFKLWEQPDLRMQWEAKPPATEEEEKALQERRHEEEREASRRRYEELAKALPPATAAGRDTMPTPEVLEEARQIRAGERGGDSSSARLMEGDCGNIATAAADKFGWDIEAGLYIQEGRRHDHVWNTLKDGTVVDIAHDQFGEPDINVARPGTTEHARYHCYCWSYKTQEEADACPVCNAPGTGGKEASAPSEDLSRLPLGSEADSTAVLRYVMAMHGDEFEEDSRIGQYEGFVLRAVPVKDINSPWGTDDTMRVLDYSVKRTPFPPIVLDASLTVIDGSYRVAAARRKRQRYIRAFVPVGGKTADSHRQAGAQRVDSLELKMAPGEDHVIQAISRLYSEPIVRRGRLHGIRLPFDLVAYHGGPAGLKEILPRSRDIPGGGSTSLAGYSLASVAAANIGENRPYPESGVYEVTVPKGEYVFYDPDMTVGITDSPTHLRVFEAIRVSGRRGRMLTADSHKQTPHRENEYPDLDEGEAVGGYGTQPECIEGARSGLGVEEIAKQIKMTEVLDGT